MLPNLYVSQHVLRPLPHVSVNHICPKCGSPIARRTAQVRTTASICHGCTMIKSITLTTIDKDFKN